MKNVKTVLTGLVCSFCLAGMILDWNTALSGAQEGISLCLYTVIPSIFPFMFFTNLLMPILTGNKSRIFSPLGKLCHIPSGAEPILLLGLLGGYPLGAQAVTAAWKNRSISKDTAKRMLGFCSNAGPSFIFGVCSGLFSDPKAIWILWFIHIISALIVGSILGKSKDEAISYPEIQMPPYHQALYTAIKAIAGICGWIILFRVLLSLLNRWVFWAIPQDSQIIVSGIMELANGCLNSAALTMQGQQFVYLSVFLGFGGLCVLAQTLSATEELGTGYYFPGKIMQAIISFLLSYTAQGILFPKEARCYVPAGILYCILLSFIALIFFKKTVAFLRNIRYNRRKIMS